MFSRTSEMFYEIMAKNLAGDTARLHHLDGRGFKGCAEHLDLFKQVTQRSMSLYIQPRKLTRPFFLSSGAKWEIGGPGFRSLSIPLKPRRNIALKAK